MRPMRVEEGEKGWRAAALAISPPARHAYSPSTSIFLLTPSPPARVPSRSPQKRQSVLEIVLSTAFQVRRLRQGSALELGPSLDLCPRPSHLISTTLILISLKLKADFLDCDSDCGFGLEQLLKRGESRAAVSVSSASPSPFLIPTQLLSFRWSTPTLFFFLFLLTSILQP